MLAASTCIVIGISSYPCSLLIQSAARRDHQVTVRLRHSPGIYPTIQWEEKKCKLSLPPNTRAASIRPQSETSRVRKAINMSRETRTGEMLGRVAAAEEVARRLRLPELLPTLAPAALQTSTDSTKSPTQFPPEQRKGFANRTRNSALTGTVKSTAPITLLATSAGFFNCSVKQKGGERNRNPRQARSRTRSAATNTI